MKKGNKRKAKNRVTTANIEIDKKSIELIIQVLEKMSNILYDMARNITGEPITVEKLESLIKQDKDDFNNKHKK